MQATSRIIRNRITGVLRATQVYKTMSLFCLRMAAKYANLIFRNSKMTACPRKPGSNATSATAGAIRFVPFSTAEKTRMLPNIAAQSATSTKNGRLNRWAREKEVKVAKDLPRCKMSAAIESGLHKALASAYEERALDLGVDVSEVEKADSLFVRVVSNLEKKHVVRDEVSSL